MLEIARLAPSAFSETLVQLASRVAARLPEPPATPGILSTFASSAFAAMTYHRGDSPSPSYSDPTDERRGKKRSMSEALDSDDEDGGGTESLVVKTVHTLLRDHQAMVHSMLNEQHALMQTILQQTSTLTQLVLRGFGQPMLAQMTGDVVGHGQSGSMLVMPLVHATSGLEQGRPDDELSKHQGGRPY